MVSTTPPIRPIQFSALKALDPLHQQPEEAEHEYGQADIGQVFHWSLQGSRNRPESPCLRPRLPVIPAEKLSAACPCAFQAAGLRALTQPMRAGPQCMRRAGGKLELSGHSARAPARPAAPYSASPRTPTS